MDLSIIILNFNTRQYLNKLLTSLKQANLKGIKHETIVVDNASSDGSIQLVKKKYPKVKLVQNDHNFGFARANNIGVRFAKGKYLFFLNSDIQVSKNSLLDLYHYLQNSKYVAATAKLVLPNHKLDWACHRGFPTPWNAFCYFMGLEWLWGKIKIFGGYHQKWQDINQTHPIPCISGACFMIKKSIFTQMGGWDESYFMYGEDIDLCYQLKQNGYKIVYYPKAKIVHFKKKSGRNKDMNTNSEQKDQNIKLNTKEHFYYTMKLFYQKNYANKYPKLIYQLILWGIKIISKFKN